MARYGVAEAKDTLSFLIDQALAGDEVVITRHGQAMVELRPVRAPQPDRKAWLDRLAQIRQDIGPISVSSAELLRLQDEDARY